MTGRVFAVMATVALLCGQVGAAETSGRPVKAKPRRQTAAKAPARVRKAPARTNPASFTPEMPFGEAIQILRNSTRPPLNIIVLWRGIGDNAGIYRDTPIGIDGLEGLRIGQYLDLLMLSLSAGASARLGYRVEKGVIVIGTTERLPVKRMTRVYDVSDLVAEPARYFLPMMGMGAMGMGGMPMMGGYGGGLGMGGAGGGGFLSGGSYGTGRGLSGLVNNLYGGNGQRSRTSRGR